MIACTCNQALGRQRHVFLGFPCTQTNTLWRCRPVTDPVNEILRNTLGWSLSSTCKCCALGYTHEFPQHKEIQAYNIHREYWIYTKVNILIWNKTNILTYFSYYSWILGMLTKLNRKIYYKCKRKTMKNSQRYFLVISFNIAKNLYSFIFIHLMYNFTMNNNEILVFIVYFSEAVVPNCETVFKSHRQGLISLSL